MKIVGGGGCKIIAHRGYALKRMENTLAAFEYAAKSKAYGIETDVHVTKDGEFVVYHDDSTLRLCKREVVIEEATLDELQQNLIYDTFTNHRVVIPTLKQYLDICKAGDKVAVIELKNPFVLEDIKRLVAFVESENYLEKSVFISFDLNNVLQLRKLLPNQELQFITITFDEKLLKTLAENKIDLDIEFTCLSRGRIEYCHSLGIKVNCWTLNDADIADLFIKNGIDFITSNNLE